MQKRVLITLITVLVAAAAFAASGEKVAQKPTTIVGTWVTTVAPPPEAELPSFTLVFTFMSDHNLIATGTGGQFPALGNPCQGTWAKEGDGFALTYVCFDFDANFQVTGMDKLTGRISSEKDGRLSGKIGLTNYDPQGQEVFSACCAAVDGSRLEVEPLAESAGWRMPRRQQ